MPSHSPDRTSILLMPDGEWVSGPDVDDLVTVLIDGFIDEVPPTDTPMPAAWDEIARPGLAGGRA